MFGVNYDGWLNAPYEHPDDYKVSGWIPLYNGDDVTDDFFEDECTKADEAFEDAYLAKHNG